MAGNPINLNPAHKGRLHAKLGVPQGKPIPAAKLAKATVSKSPVERKEADFAETASKWNHGGRGKKPTTTPIKTDRGSFGVRGQD